MEIINGIFYIAILIMSVVIHEVSHGFMALYFGDQTAKHQGRLTLNPINHLDPFGSVLIPLVSYFAFGFAFGWAKPVPYNPDNLRDQKWGSVWVAAAGVLANLFIALFFGLVLRFLGDYLPDPRMINILSIIVIVNIALAVFNMIPIHPLDGSKVVYPILPILKPIENFIEQYSFIVLLIFIFFFSQYLAPVVFGIFNLIVG